jgi:tetratricopeptide (TPR) repeat protein
MGTVYRAADSVSGLTVALKVLHDKHSSSADRFNQEAALLSDLAHPAIVRYVDHGMTPAGDHYLAMEWLEGETLEDRLARGPLGLMDSIRLTRRVLEGLAVAHRKGIVHRDLKPANLFLPERDLAQVKILDFGIARRVFDTRRMTMTGSALGTPMYMSPEQVRGARAVDARSDIFSMGSLFYECLTGAPPFAADTPMAVLARICLDERVDVAARADLPAPLARVLDRMLAKNPDERPASAGELAAELAVLADDLARMGLHTGSVVREAPAAAPAPRLEGGEQRVVSAILVSRPRGNVVKEQPPSTVGTWDVPSNGTRHSFADLFDEATFAKIEKALEPFGARAERFLGNAMLVTLSGSGTPTDQAAQAARCALALKGLLPRVSFALSTGRASLEGKLSLGELIDAAARMLVAEDPGAVRVDEMTAGLLESRFEVHGGERGHHLLFEKDLKEAPRTVLGKEIPCVGRDREINNLLGLWEEAISEPVARAVLITAPAGGGKSRVRHELLDRISDKGERFAFLVGRGDALRAGAPFALLSPALRSLFGIAGGEPPEVQQKRISSYVQRHVAPAISRRVAAFLGEICGVAFADDDLPPLRAARQDPRLMADQTLSAWLDFLEAECKAQPVLLVFEDMHWGDAPSVQLVDAALRTLRDQPLMVLGFSRPDVDDKFPNLWCERDLQRIALAPLTPKSAQKLIAHMVADLPPEKAAWIVERADGNPFYLEELVRAVSTGGSTQHLPDTVIGMVQARFDAIGNDAKRVLRAAAVYGQTFRASGLRALLGDEDRSLDQWLDILAQREVLFPKQAAHTREFTFRHALLQEAAYEMLTPGDRVLGHRLAGEFLEAEGEKQAIVLVEHFERGAEPKKAAHWCRFAAEQALEANDLGLVIERVERGVRLGAEGEVFGQIHLIEAQARNWLGEYAAAKSAAEAACAVLTGPPSLLATSELIAALGQQSLFAQVEQLAITIRDDRPPLASEQFWLTCLVRAMAYLFPGGRYETAESLLRDIEAMEQLLDAPTRARLEAVRAHVAHIKGDQARALTAWQSAADLYEKLSDTRSITEMRGNIGAALFALGMLEEAEEHLKMALAVADRMQLFFVGAIVLANLTSLLADLGRLDEARQTGERVAALATKQGDHRLIGAADLFLAIVEFRAGRLSAAADRSTAAIAELQDVPPVLPAALAIQARTLLKCGRKEPALALAREANQLLETSGFVEEGEALIRLTLAECLIAAGKEAEAVTVIAAAMHRLSEQIRAMSNPVWRDRFLTRLPHHVEICKLAQSLELPEISTAVPDNGSPA